MASASPRRVRVSISSMDEARLDAAAAARQGGGCYARGRRAGTNHVYDVTVHAKDGNNNVSATENLTITVTNDTSDDVVIATPPTASTATTDPNNNDALGLPGAQTINDGNDNVYSIRRHRR